MHGVNRGAGAARLFRSKPSRDANDRMSAQKDVIDDADRNALESVDPYEASTRVNTLLTQIETSYALTARIQQLSLLDYL